MNLLSFEWGIALPHSPPGVLFLLQYCPINGTLAWAFRGQFVGIFILKSDFSPLNFAQKEVPPSLDFTGVLALFIDFARFSENGLHTVQVWVKPAFFLASAILSPNVMSIPPCGGKNNFIIFFKNFNQNCLTSYQV